MLVLEFFCYESTIATFLFRHFERSLNLKCYADYLSQYIGLYSPLRRHEGIDVSFGHEWHQCGAWGILLFHQWFYEKDVG